MIDFAQYLSALRSPFKKLCRLRFLQPDGSTAFSLDNDPLNKRANTFIKEGQISVNLQNGQRRTANVTLSNLNNEYDYNINNVWFGQQIALDEGLVLPDGTEYYIQQGVFYIQEPGEEITPSSKKTTFNLVDKWAYLDGTLFGNLESTYQVNVGTNIFAAMRSVLLLDRGNGVSVDNVVPVFTEFYNGKTQALVTGGTAELINAPYTLTVDNDSGTYADVLLGLAEMLNALVGYDATGRLRVDPSQDDILDTTKPVLWNFRTDETQILGMSYTIHNSQTFNDCIIVGEQLENYAQPAGRAVNMDPRSDTNIYTSLGRRVKRETASGYATDVQCRDRAAWELKRQSVLQKSVQISCQQMFHLNENNLVTIVRSDKPGSPVERHLIQGFSRPLPGSGNMTIDAISVNDFVTPTIVPWTV